ncbi:hypothetical protein [Lysobacter fragariae]
MNGCRIGWLFLATLVLGGSAVPMAWAQDDTFARMDIRGENGDEAWLDEVRVKKYQKNVQMSDGSVVRTGEDTGALVTMPTSEVLLSEHSEKLITYSYFKGARCYLVRLKSGKALINGSNVCFMTDDAPLGFYSHSLINVRHDNGAVEVTVLEGMAEVERPEPMHLHDNQRLIVWPDGTFQRYDLTPKQAKGSIHWAKRYVERSDTGKKIAKGGATVVLFYALCRLFDGCDGGGHGGGTKSTPVDGDPPPEAKCYGDSDHPCPGDSD